MDAEARALASMLLGSFPGRQIGEMNIIAIGHALDQFEPKTATEACRLLSERCLNPPSVAEVYEACREVDQETAHRLELERWAAEQKLDPAPARELHFTEPPKVVTRAVDGMEINDAWLRYQEALKAPMRPPRPRPPACSGSNATPVRRDGRWVCPGCGAEVR
jgi:hypothetical protein